MINLTSKKFANTFLGIDKEIISIEEFCYATALVIFCINLYVHFFTQEVKETEEERFKSIFLKYEPKELQPPSTIYLKRF